MELNASLSAPADAGKQMLFDMIEAGATHDTGIESVNDISGYRYLGLSRGKMQFVVAVEDDSSGYVLSLMTFDLNGVLDISEGFVNTFSRKLDSTLAKAKASDFS
jgi:hypothetical protein